MVTKYLKKAKRPIKIILTLFVFQFFLLGCNNHYMTLTMLTEQLNEDVLNKLSERKIITYNGIYEFYRTSYKPNGLWEVICIEKKTGKMVALSINKDTTLVIVDNSGKKHRLYFDTVHIFDNKVFGLYSRFIYDPKEIDFNDIDKIEIHSELSKTRYL